MAISSAIAIFFVLWWIVLFAVLPFGVRSQREDGEEIAGTDPGAPTLPGMLRKVIWTTAISLVLFGIGTAAYRAGYFNIERLSQMMGFPF